MKVSSDEDDDMTIETIEDESISDVVEGQVSDFVWLCVGKRKIVMMTVDCHDD